MGIPAFCRLLKAVLATFLTCSPAMAQVPWTDPIAYVGHGAMFDREGREISGTASAIGSMQAEYMAQLTPLLTAGQRTEFEAFRQAVTPAQPVDGQSQLILNARLIDWLTAVVRGETSALIRDRNTFLKNRLSYRLPTSADPAAQRPLNRFSVGPELKLKMDENPPPPPVVLLSLTGNGGADYRAECAANGVPLPVSFGPGSGWTPRALPGNPDGIIEGADLFIERGMRAQVLTLNSTAPEGVCVALPRFGTDNIVTLDGIICLGKASSKACFWDNQKNGVPFTFVRGAARNINDWGGGTELRGGVAGYCSDCHAGENPFIIHGDVLDSLDAPIPASAGVPAQPALPMMPDAWHSPIVRSGDALPWPENPGPMNAPSACASCHGTAAARGFAGRLPHLSTALGGHCASVLRPAIGMATSGAPASMPQGAPGSLANTPAMNALVAWCVQGATGNPASRGDPHLTTFNGITYDFQSAGEFTYLRGDDGLEIQTRQTAVSTAAAVRNGHTGLSSCVSVNTAVAARMGKHRVTLQPNAQAPRRIGLELRIDGELVPRDRKRIDLGESGMLVLGRLPGSVEMILPDEGRLVITSNWWTAQELWYLNLDIVGGTGREGLAGAILGRDWLPLLPDGESLGPRPVALNDRHDILHGKFADAWRVTDTSSLFDYAPGTSTANFTNPSWPPAAPPCIAPDRPAFQAEPMPPRKAREICRKVQDKEMRAQCIFDLRVTGDPGFAETYSASEQLAR